MQFQLIRSATLRLEYAGKKFMIDPYLAAKHSLPSYTGASPNPVVDLRCSPQEAVAGLEMVLVSHLHSDHFDTTAQNLLPKDMPVLCQPEDELRIKAMGFRNVVPVADTVEWAGVTITRTAGQHGSGEVLQQMGPVSGFVFQGKNEPTVYWAGDTIWCKAVADVIASFQPAIIITHSSGAVWGQGGLIVMDAVQTAAVCHAAPNSIVIATHMESLDHATVSRAMLREYADARRIPPEKLLIPQDLERYVFTC